jgi:hypothetical protein
MALTIRKAERKQSKLRLALTGPSGSGKTYSALTIARNLGRVAVIDTERGSASLYSNLCDFDAIDLDPPYTPERFIEALNLVQAGKYDVCIIDSTTHEWNGLGGCLELVDTLAASRYKGNSWAAWNDVTPRHRAFVDAVIQSPCHIIATMRSKTETAQTDGANGRKQVIKLGMKSEQRDGIEYEFTTVLDISHEGHLAIASKDRTGLFGRDPELITDATATRLLDWLNSGSNPSLEIFAKAKTAIQASSGDGAKLDRIRKGIETYVADRKLNPDHADELRKLCDFEMESLMASSEQDA